MRRSIIVFVTATLTTCAPSPKATVTPPVVSQPEYVPVAPHRSLTKRERRLLMDAERSLRAAQQRLEWIGGRATVDTDR